MKDEATPEQLAMARRIAEEWADNDGLPGNSSIVNAALAAIIETTAQVERLEIVLPGFGAGLADGASIAKRQIVAHLKGQDHG